MPLHVKAGKTPMNKWLMLSLILAIVLTVWWAFISDNASDDDVIEVSERKLASSNLLDKNALNKPQNKLKNNKKPASNTFTASADNVLIPWQLLNREPVSNKPVNIFKVHSWLEAPRAIRATPIVAPIPIMPVAPVVPAAPFIYMGQMLDTPKGTQVFLINNGVLVTVVTGEKINQQWRLDSQNESSLHLTYLPLNLPQILYKTAIAADAQSPALTIESNQSTIDSLNIDPPESGGLELEELRL